MKNIMFVGDGMNGYFAQEVAQTRGWQYYQIDADADIKKATNDILTFIYSRKISIDIIIYDADVFLNDAAVIAKEIRGAANTISAKPIVYMPSFLPESALAGALLANDIKNYILSGSTADLKDQLEKNITGFFDANGRKEVEEILQLQAEAKTHIDSFKTIGVAGSQERIGTTTQCLQIIKYLQAKGYRACYIELNQKKYYDMSSSSGKISAKGFVEKYALWSGAEDTDYVDYRGIKMYSSHGMMKAREESFDYYVYDYGSVTDRDFDRIAYLKDEVKILVAGGKPTEFDFLQRILQMPTYTESALIMSFIPENEQEDVLKTLSELENKSRPVMFAEYAPDPVLPVPVEVYESLIPLEDKPSEVGGAEKKKKRRLFGRKK